jgi:hypothetical protein
MKKRVFACVLVMAAFFGVSPLLLTTANAVQPKFLGSSTCKDCHKALYASWEKSIHAKVFELLPPGVRVDKKKEAGLKGEIDYRKDSSCMNCHATGVDQGGYSFATPSSEFEGIGCEECHGASENWILIHDKAGLKNKERLLKQAGMTEPNAGKTVCLRCHGHRNSPYRFRSEGVHALRDWTDPKWAETYHIVPEVR